MLLGVSIHTPTQGVTHPFVPQGKELGFNPHTHAGCDNGNIQLETT